MDGEGETVGVGTGELEGEIIGEGLDVDGSSEEGAACFIASRIGVGEAEAGGCGIPRGAAVELQAGGGGEAGTKIDGGRTGADGVSGAADSAVGVAGSDSDGFDGFGRADGDGRGIFGGGSRGGGAVGGVVDGGTGGGVADGYRLRGGIGAGRGAEGRSRGSRRRFSIGRTGDRALQMIRGSRNSLDGLGRTDSNRSRVERRRGGGSACRSWCNRWKHQKCHRKLPLKRFP